uniref:Uncharacterized protein n=1 Tax=Sphaerodactylus townsendi TaxID=933632 RepID=A0ACB8FKG9_9SAUR
MHAAHVTAWVSPASSPARTSRPPLPRPGLCRAKLPADAAALDRDCERRVARTDERSVHDGTGTRQLALVTGSVHDQ